MLVVCCLKKDILYQFWTINFCYYKPVILNTCSFCEVCPWPSSDMNKPVQTMARNTEIYQRHDTINTLEHDHSSTPWSLINVRKVLQNYQSLIQLPHQRPKLLWNGKKNWHKCKQNKPNISQSLTISPRVQCFLLHCWCWQKHAQIHV